MRPGKNRDWSREEHILAFNLYCKIPFGAIHVRNPQIIALARLLGRSVGSVSYKLANFSRLDPELKARGIRGMPHGAKGEADVWNEFNRDPEALAFESERLLSKLSGRKLEEIAEVNESELPEEGIEREYVLRARVNQHFFRSAILAAYNSCCCVTGLAIPQLLVASHIVPWALEPAQRMNPRNGLCLNALHDRAFDRGLMVIGRDLRVRFADSVRAGTTAHPEALNWLVSFHGQQVTLPKKFLPDLGLLTKHRRLCERKESFSPA
jgi:putative restriction endonuclease